MKFELVIALMLQFVQAMRKDQSVERLALRKVQRPLNHFECNTPPLWYCKLPVFGPRLGLQQLLVPASI